jgi:hypothetical protein
VLTDVRREEIDRLKAEEGTDTTSTAAPACCGSSPSCASSTSTTLPVHPVVLGGGLPLFGDVAHGTELALDSVTPHGSGVVRLVYRSL